MAKNDDYLSKPKKQIKPKKKRKPKISENTSVGVTFKKPKKPRLSSKPPREKLTKEQISEIRRKAALKRKENIQRKILTDPEYRKKYEENKRKSAERLKQWREQQEKTHTPEELKKQRSKSAKKASETIKSKMTKDPLYRQKMEEIYKKSGERLKEFNKQKREEKQRELQKQIAEDKWEEYEDEYTVDEEELDICQIIFNNLMDFVDNEAARNKSCQKLLHRILNENYPEDRATRQEYIDEVKSAKNELYDRAEIVLFTSDSSEARGSLYAFAEIIAPHASYSAEIDVAIEEDFSYVITKRGMRKLRDIIK